MQLVNHVLHQEDWSLPSQLARQCSSLENNTQDHYMHKLSIGRVLTMAAMI